MLLWAVIQSLTRSMATGRSSRHGCGRRPASRSRACVAVKGPRISIGSPLAGAALVTSSTSRSSMPGRFSRASILAIRSDQFGALAQPLSTTMMIGPAPGSGSRGFRVGWDAARISRAANTMRSNKSQSGRRDGVCSLGSRSRSSSRFGNRIRRGRGGSRRNIHHRAGSASSPVRTQGVPNANVPPNMLNMG